MTGSGRGVQERDMGAKTDSQQDGRTGKQLVADVESSVTAVRSAAGFLAGSSHSVIGGAPSSSALADAVTSTPEKVRKKVFELAGRIEALRQKKVSEVDVDAIDRWVVDDYSPERTGMGTPTRMSRTLRNSAGPRQLRRSRGTIRESRSITCMIRHRIGP